MEKKSCSEIPARLTLREEVSLSVDFLRDDFQQFEKQVYARLCSIEQQIELLKEKKL